jgi:hypothetical protein
MLVHYGPNHLDLVAAIAAIGLRLQLSFDKVSKHFGKERFLFGIKTRHSLHFTKTMTENLPN